MLQPSRFLATFTRLLAFGNKASERERVLSDEHLERRLAAILAADIAGYSSLMGADEEGTLPN